MKADSLALTNDYTRRAISTDAMMGRSVDHSGRFKNIKAKIELNETQGSMDMQIKSHNATSWSVLCVRPGGEANNNNNHEGTPSLSWEEEEEEEEGALVSDVALLSGLAVLGEQRCVGPPDRDV